MYYKMVIASKTAQGVKLPSTVPDDLSSILRAHMVVGENRFLPDTL